MRTSFHFSPTSEFERKLLQYIANQFFGFCFKGRGWGDKNESGFQLFAGFGEKEKIGFFDSKRISEFVDASSDYIISHLTYDVKNELEKLHSKNMDGIEFPLLQFTIPSIVFFKKENQWTIEYQAEDFEESEITELLSEIETIELQNPKFNLPPVQNRLSKTEYLEALARIQEHIQLGNIYQANFCQEFYWENAEIEPTELFYKGFELNPNPFSVYYKTGNNHCISFSPERFISVDGKQLLSQPMKGTAPRGQDAEDDQSQIDFLKNSEKDRRENVMIVDMVRNDLSHFAAKGSVKVPELYKIETYPKVHQMYSTVTAELKECNQLMDALLKCFPMGSMTGAPKISAMKIIEDLEYTKRGMFSGTIGYFTPDHKADFNVIIRTLLYNEDKQYLSCHVGGGITIMSDPEGEYDECLVKFNPIKQLIQRISQ